MSIVQAGRKSRLGDLNSENIDHEKGKRHDGMTTGPRRDAGLQIQSRDWS